MVVAHPDNRQIHDLVAMLKGTPPPRMEMSGPTPVEWSEAGRRMHGEATESPMADD